MVTNSSRLRERMIERHLRARGVRDGAVLEAMRAVDREAFLPAELAMFAWEDTALPIGEGQTISQPFIVALMAEALELSPGDRVLEVGTGSGYAAAVLAELAGEVYTIERHRELADRAAERLGALGYDNVVVHCGDGTRGWPEQAPFDAIVIAAGGPDVPRPLQEQLAVGGRLVIPVGDERLQHLVRVRRVDERTFRREALQAVRFVPLVGEHGWNGHRRASTEPEALADVVRAAASPFDEVEDADLEPLLRRIGDARVVCLGEATHGTSEFYRMRTRITRALVERRGFTIVAAEADWPDMAQVDAWIRGRPAPLGSSPPFTRFPRWMWRNEEFAALVGWLRHFATGRHEDQRAGLFGLDLYSLHASIEAVVAYLDDVDPEAAAVARSRYGCLSPWEQDPAAYGRAASKGRRFRACEDEVVAMLRDLEARRLDDAARDGDRHLGAAQNARLIANAERYYRVMYHGTVDAWNLRDQHMFDTLQALLEHHGPRSKAVVWAHNSHVGDAAATEMGARGEHNVGHLCRRAYGDAAYLIGFGTDHGTVAAAEDWDGDMQRMNLRPSLPESYEAVFHRTGLRGFFLPLRADPAAEARERLMIPRLQRAIGVVYRPRTELQSHYFQTVLPQQFDELVWIDETRAVTVLDPTAAAHGEAPPETWPFGL